MAPKRTGTKAPAKEAKTDTKKMTKEDSKKEETKKVTKTVSKSAEKVEKVAQPAPDASPVEPESPKAEKRKAEETTTTEPAAKEAKVEKEAEAPVAEKEEVVEKEQDDVPSKAPKLKTPVGFNTVDTTLNVLPAFGGKALTCLNEGGMQYLIAGARANVGAKAGRHMFEVKLLETNPVYGDSRAKPNSRPVVRVGFSTSKTSLILGESEEHMYFDLDGSFLVGKKRTPAGKRLNYRSATVAVVLNLDAKSPNANTVSLFSDGVRISQPQAIPEGLQGKTLFPHVCYRNVKVLVQFTNPTVKLPFVCRGFGGANVDDVEKVEEKKPKDGKYEVLFPVGFPDEGTFDWLDDFMAKHPNHVELSDRKIIAWAKSSGLWAQRPGTGCNDKPECNFGLPGMDDFSARRVINAVSSIVPRDYVVMEVRANLLQKERQINIKRFAKPCFKKVAYVMMGEPTAEFKAAQLESMRQAKQTKADLKWRQAKIEKERKKLVLEKQKKLRDAIKKREEEKAAAEKEKAEKEKAAAEAKDGDAEKKEDGEKKEEKEEEKKEDAAGKDEKKETEQEEKKPEEEEATKMDVDEPAEAEEEEDMATEPPRVELTDEEKKVWFAPKTTHDLKEQQLNQCFGDFSLPTSGEGFASIKYQWQNEEVSKAYLRDWIVKRKRVTKMDFLQPSQWFTDKVVNFTEKFQAWRAAQTTYKKSDQGKKDDEAKRRADDGAEDTSVDVDIDTVENVEDTGNGRPLFKDFKQEDWALLHLRHDLVLLQAAFKHDANDADREGIPEAHLQFYFQKYYRRTLTPKHFGCDSIEALLKFIDDSVAIEDGILTSTEDIEELGNLVKRAENSRLERERRLEAGDETVRLHVMPQALPAAGVAKQAARAVAAVPAVTGAAPKLTPTITKLTPTKPAPGAAAAAVQN